MSRIRTVAGDLRFPEGPVVSGDGAVILSEMAGGRLVRVEPDGRVEPYAEVGGGPNGLAAMAEGSVVVCQSGGSRFGLGPWPRPGDGSVQIFRPIGEAAAPVEPSIQRVGPDGSVSTLATTFTTANGEIERLSKPCDVVADGLGGFYVSDLGSVRGRQRDVTGVVYGTPAGDLIEVVFPVEMPNGVALSPSGDVLYVAETRTRRIWAFEIVEPGHVGAARGLATVPSGGPMNVGGADGLCVDRDGRIVVATLGTGGVTVFDAGGALLGSIPMDDPLTTNAALGEDESVLYVTLASTGRLVAVDDWLDALEPPR